MTYTYREKNAAGKPNPCSCINLETKSFCQNDFCAELDSNGDIIYRGDPHNGNYPPLRNNAGYQNINGSGLYDNINKSIGHRSPCNLELEIYNSESHNYCTDCEELNGVYDSIHNMNLQSYVDSAGIYNSIPRGSVWNWPLCRPDKIGNSCGASFAYGYLDFDENDNFNPVTASGRNVYLNIRIAGQLIDYPPFPNIHGQINSLCTVYTLGQSPSVISGCPLAYLGNYNYGVELAHKRIKVGELKYKDGKYYDSNIDCTSFNQLEVNEDVHIRGLCDLDFKVTSKNEDDLLGFKKSVAYQRATYFDHSNQLTFDNYNDGYPYIDDGYHGLRYNLCDDSINGPYAINNPPSEYDLDLPTLTTEYDPYWNITRVYEKHPHFWNVTINDAEGRASGLNAEHFLFPYEEDIETVGTPIFPFSTTAYTNRIVKKLDYYDSEIATENLYGDYNQIGCDNNCILDDICINKMKLDLNNNDDRINFYFYLTGGTSSNGSIYVAYSGSAPQSTNKGWLSSPLTLDFGEAYFTRSAVNYPINNIYNLENLNITVNNANTYEDVNQLACFPVPRNPNIKGGKEPDAFLVEFTDDWVPGYLPVEKPVYHSIDDLPEDFVSEMIDIFGEDFFYKAFSVGYCEGPTGDCETIKLIDSCYQCEKCITNCADQAWAGPVGSFLLTRVFDYSFGLSNDCIPNNTCQNYGGQDNPIKYAYVNNDDKTICNWSHIKLEIQRGNNDEPCEDESFDEEKIHVSMSVSWHDRNENDPDVTYCRELAYDANHNPDCSSYCIQSDTPPEHIPCNEDAVDCVDPQVKRCNSPCNSEGGYIRDIVEDASETSSSTVYKRYFYTNLDLNVFENFKYIEFDDVNGHDLTYYDGNDVFNDDIGFPDNGCPFSQCYDEGEWEMVPGTPPTLIKTPIPDNEKIFHGKWGGGTVKVTPIYY